ncbi:hypothetical protein SORDD16_01488 [Streptococcus oralis]|uniref:Uncharacterized protein n=1 Tax=Streptococcus oralis TaxID=1303 RepID=A0A139PAP6_STROR|nr:hypothetical protein SORDD16_01488 [Streptococcus oralis]
MVEKEEDALYLREKGLALVLSRFLIYSFLNGFRMQNIRLIDFSKTFFRNFT